MKKLEDYKMIKKYSKKICKSIVALLLIMSIAFSELYIDGMKDIFAASVSTYGYTNSGKWAYKILDKKNKTAEIYPSTETGDLGKKLKIPKKINIGNNKYTVVKIPDYAFMTCFCPICLDGICTLKDAWEKSSYDYTSVCYRGYDLTWIYKFQEVEIPSTVTEIGENAFSYSPKLKKITFESGSKLSKIKKEAFEETPLESITIPASVQTIEQSAFEYSEISKIYFEKGSKLKKIGNAAFSYTNINEINLPESLVTIGNECFKHCPIKQITVPKLVTDIGEYAFWYTNIETITFKAEKTFNMQDSAFLGTPVKQINVENYDVYNCVINNYSFYSDEKNREIKIYSAKSRIFINDKNYGDVSMKANKKATIDLANYIPKKKGVHYELNTAKALYSFGIDSEGEVYISKKNILSQSNDESSKNKIISEGYPYINITADTYENMYIIDCPQYYMLANVDKQKYYYVLSYNENVIFDKYPTNSGFQKKGYYIDGYMLTSEATGESTVYTEGTSASGLTEIHQDRLTVSLKYSPNRYMVTYNGNASGVSTEYISDQKCQYDDSSNITEEIPVRRGYKFKGWCTDKYGKDKIYQSGGEFINLTEDNDVVVTLYAIWEDGLFNMNFNANGGEVAQTSMQVEYESPIGKSLPIPERDGYDFVGWTTGRIGGKTVDSTYVVNFLSDFTVYAQWDEKEYSVSFDGNGGTLTQSSKKVDYNQSIGLLPKPIRDGYVFDGWFTSKDGGNKISAVTKIRDNITYYAHWIQKTKRICLKVTPPGGKRVSGYQVSYTKNGELVFDNTFATSAMSSLPITINGAKSGETYVIRARYYVLKKGKKKWSKVTIKTITVD